VFLCVLGLSQTLIHILEVVATGARMVCQCTSAVWLSTF